MATRVAPPPRTGVQFLVGGGFHTSLDLFELNSAMQHLSSDRFSGNAQACVEHKFQSSSLVQQTQPEVGSHLYPKLTKTSNLVGFMGIPCTGIFDKWHNGWKARNKFTVMQSQKQNRSGRQPSSIVLGLIITILGSCPLYLSAWFD